MLFAASVVVPVMTRERLFILFNLMHQSLARFTALDFLVRPARRGRERGRLVELESVFSRLIDKDQTQSSAFLHGATRYGCSLQV
jgi:hypothetical protein